MKDDEEEKLIARGAYGFFFWWGVGEIRLRLMESLKPASGNEKAKALHLLL